MEKFDSPLGIILLTFVIGITSAFFWFNYSSSVESYDQINPAEIPSVEYFDLKNNPHKYSGKIVRVNAKLNWFMHGYFLGEEDYWSDGEGRTAISFYKPKAEENFRFLEQFRKSHPWKPLNIRAVGLFKYEKPKGGSDGVEDRTSFHFEIYKIESAKR